MPPLRFGATLAQPLRENNIFVIKNQRVLFDIPLDLKENF